MKRLDNGFRDGLVYLGLRDHVNIRVKITGESTTEQRIVQGKSRWWKYLTLKV